MRPTRRIFVLAALAGALAPAAPAAAAAKPPTLTARAPATIAPRGVVIVMGHGSGASASEAVSLELHVGSRWVAVARAAIGTGGRYALHWSIDHHSGVLRLRVVLVRGGHVLATSMTRDVQVNQAAPTIASSAAAVVVVSPRTIHAAPAPGMPGTVVLDNRAHAAGGPPVGGGRAIVPGTFLASTVGPQTPDGLLDKVTSVVQHSGTTVVSTRPARLTDVLPTGGRFALSGGARVDATGARVAAGGLAGRFGEQLGKAFSCSAGGPKLTAKGHVQLNEIPSLSASWSPWDGVSVQFTERLGVSASLTGELSATGKCSIAKTPLLAHPAPLGTFATSVAGLPIVVSFVGQVYVDGAAQAIGSMTAGISGTASASGGIRYENGQPLMLASSASAKLGSLSGSVDASGSVRVHVTPEVQALFYGVGGPSFDAETGLELNADVNANPWWTLTAPLDVTAALVVPPLGISTSPLPLYTHSFPVAKAPGPFNPGTGTIPGAPGT